MHGWSHGQIQSSTRGLHLSEIYTSTVLQSTTTYHAHLRIYINSVHELLTQVANSSNNPESLEWVL